MKTKYTKESVSLENSASINEARITWQTLSLHPLKLELVKHPGEEQEELLLCQALAKAVAPADAKGVQFLSPAFELALAIQESVKMRTNEIHPRLSKWFNQNIALRYKPVWIELLRIVPQLGIMMDTIEILDNNGSFGNDIFPNPEVS